MQPSAISTATPVHGEEPLQPPSSSARGPVRARDCRCVGEVNVGGHPGGCSRSIERENGQFHHHGGRAAWVGAFHDGVLPVASCSRWSGLPRDASSKAPVTPRTYSDPLSLWGTNRDLPSRRVVLSRLRRRPSTEVGDLRVSHTGRPDRCPAVHPRDTALPESRWPVVEGCIRRPKAATLQRAQAGRSRTAADAEAHSEK
jgi:hypothetical protein